jgi:hypothetical protein
MCFFPPYRPRSGTAQHSNSSVYIMSILLYNILLEILFSCNNFNCCFVLVTVRFHGLFLLAHGVCAVNNADDESVNLEETLMAIVVRYMMVTTHTQNYGQRWSPLESWNNSKVHRGQLREKRLGTKLRQPAILYCLSPAKMCTKCFHGLPGVLAETIGTVERKKNPIRCLIIPSTFFNFGK